MVRYLPVGNSRLLVSFDRDYRIVDLYYGRGQSDNHAVGHPFMFGISVGDQFRWVDRSIIEHMDYLDETMIGNVRYSIGNIHFENFDFVDIYKDIYLKRIRVFNNDRERKEIRFFFHQNFYIYGNDIGDTAFYSPELNAVVHYKAGRYFLCSTLDSSNKSIDQYAVGIKAYEGFEGTWKDAEDGNLSLNPVAIGSVDSVVRSTVLVEPGETKELYYFIMCGDSLDSVKDMKNGLTVDQANEMYRRTSNYWEVWSSKKDIQITEEIRSLFRKSQFIIRAHINNYGGIMASSDSDILKNNRDGYYYVWPRDAAIATYALTRTLHFSASRRFFDFTLRAVTDEGYFLHKYMPDGKMASSWIPRIMGGNPIIPIQEDETALVIWAFWQYYLNSFDVEYFYPFYEPMIKKCADFLVRYTDQDGLPKPSYDIWEERYGVHTFTVATVYAALKAASNFAETFGDYGPKERYSVSAKKMAESYERLFYSDEKGYYARAIINGIPDFTVDSQNMALFMFGMKDARDPRMRSNMQKIMDKLWVGNSGGLSRYENDNYQRLKPDPKVPGNPWIITTLWASRYFLKIGEKERAMELIKWVLDHSQKSGMLSEQINPYDNTPVSVSPLIWSHAEFIITILEYLNSA
ncbi:MAG: glycoside hydrolase family 15 protein [Thermoplasmatales archaeon]